MPFGIKILLWLLAGDRLLTNKERVRRRLTLDEPSLWCNRNTIIFYPATSMMLVEEAETDTALGVAFTDRALTLDYSIFEAERWGVLQEL
ncbi:hypothetical protein V6N11_010817 [Hibiscus sabdariffa]|uniref:Uncharacterized protein n=1 Tax=Hibiscus sabdariffa TaxID=183260 RepID=A0ABR2S6L3_9ROSI